MNKKIPAHVALFTLNLLYAISYFVIKSVTPTFLGANGFVLIRASGALVLFWIFGALMPKEVVHRSDYKKFAIAALFGVVFNQLSFFNGMPYTSPNYSAIIMTSTPIIVLIISALYLKESITKNKVIGMILGGLGAVTIILQNEVTKDAPNPILGNILIFSNAANFGFYIVYCKPLMEKYNPFTVLKWVFLFGTIILFPIGLSDLQESSWNFPMEIWVGIIYVIVGITFLTFLLNMYSIKKVSPNVATTYIFLQPFLSALLSYIINGKIMDYKSIGASVLIFTGVYFVSFRKSFNR
ncbi:MAG: EamA family transporter [Flavobacteriales bacterium]|nr:EamA family transporter [Flavobacteriales bacterium]